MSNYVAGWNMASYSPDPDNLWITDDFGAAVDYLRETVARWQDQDYMGVVCDCPCHDDGPNTSDHNSITCVCADLDDIDSPDDIDARYSAALEDLDSPGEGPAFHTVVYDRNGYLYAFWVAPTDETPEDD